MHNVPTPLALFFVWMLFPLLLQAQQKLNAVARADTLMQRFISHSDIPGAAVTVAIGDSIVWSRGYGYADLEQQVPVDPARTKFRIGSISKPITAAALGVLYDRGEVDLDAPVQNYVSFFPEKRAPVTLRRLAGHLAGIRHYRDDEFMSSKRYATVADGIALFAADTLLFAPGERYAYSSYGWNLISAAVEGAAGTPFLTFLEKNVLHPLEMHHTRADFTDSLIAFRARFYSKTEAGKIINAPYVDNSYKWAGGGLLSTTEDLVRFGAAHLSAGLLGDTTLALWTTSQRTAGGKRTGYGMGWALEKDATGARAFGHRGGSVGGVTQLLIYPETQVVVAILTNSDRVDYGDTHFRIAHLLAPAPRSYPILDADARELAGAYQIDDEEKTLLNVTIKDGRLQAATNGSLPRLLWPLNGRRYTTLDGGYQLRFDKRGGVTISYRHSGESHSGRKQPN